MRKQPILLVGGGLALILVLALGYYLASPLFIDNAVDEAFPFAVPDGSAIAAMNDGERAALEADFMAALPDETTVAALTPEDEAALEETVQAAAAAVMMDKEMDDAMPAAEPIRLGQGTFAGADNFHLGSGSATVYELPDGERVLRLEDFSVTNGPDLHVILVRNPAPAGRADVGDDYIDLGSLKGNMGNQNYTIPADVDLTGYQSVVIYCVPFHVVFATAGLGS